MFVIQEIVCSELSLPCFAPFASREEAVAELAEMVAEGESAERFYIEEK